MRLFDYSTQLFMFTFILSRISVYVFKSVKNESERCSDVTTTRQGRKLLPSSKLQRTPRVYRKKITKNRWGTIDLWVQELKSQLLWFFLFSALFSFVYFLFLPRCMECRRGFAMRFLSVCPSVCLSVRLSNACIVSDKTEEKSDHIFIPCDR